MTKKMDVSAGSGGRVAVLRIRFDAHVDHCPTCARGLLCATAETLWRNVCLAAMREQGS